MTQREFLTAIVEGRVTEAEVEFAKAAIQKLNDRNEARRNTLSAKREANEATKEAITEWFTEGGAEFTATAKETADKFGFSTQKAQALLGQLVEAGILTNEKPKKSAAYIFKLAQ